jgi:hypothetical protein
MVMKVRYSLILVVFLLVGTSYAFGQGQKEIPDPDFRLVGDKSGILVDQLQANEEVEAAIREKDLSVKEQINYNPCISFVGKESILEIPYPLEKLSRVTLFTVYQCADTVGEYAVWSSKNSDNSMLLTTGRISGPSNIIEYDGGNSTIPVLNVSTQFWGTPKEVVSEGAVLLGGLSYDFEQVKSFQGGLAEVIMYHRFLGQEERERIESYLALKYGITLPQSSYFSSTGETIWDYFENKAFSNRIAGIGRDDGFQLDQKQSSSSAAPGFLTIGLGTIAPSNSENSFSTEPGHFLVWGDNDLPLLLKEYKEEGVWILDREWLMQTTHPFAGEWPTEVAVDFSNIDVPDGFVPALFIDRSAKGVAESFTKKIYTAEKRTDEGYAHFFEVQWDTDGSGEDLFSFGIIPVEIEGVNTFSVQPNPSNGSFEIVLDLSRESDVIVQIFDVQGRLVRQYSEEPGLQHRLKGNLQEPGEYLVELQTGAGRLSEKLIIVK